MPRKAKSVIDVIYTTMLEKDNEFMDTNYRLLGNKHIFHGKLKFCQWLVNSLQKRDKQC